MTELRYTLKAVPRITITHLDLITNFGDRHITQESLNLYRSGVILESVLVEAFELGSNKLIGLSFATRVGENYTYSVTVVHKDYRKHGVALILEQKKRDIITMERGLPYVSQVHVTNESSVKLMKHVTDKWYISNEHMIFVSEPKNKITEEENLWKKITWTTPWSSVTPASTNYVTNT